MHCPVWQTLPVAQCVSFIQNVPHAPITQAKPFGQGITPSGVQTPEAHFDSSVHVEPTHEDAWHTVVSG
jgi:hypothetical protein